MNYKLVISYDGSRYHGWQRLGNSDATIQGKIENVLTKMTGEQIELIGSGRTDAGVHAAKQVANFRTDISLTPDEIESYLRNYLPEDIGILSVIEIDERFHSRFHAVEKTYRYRIWNSSLPCVFERKYVWRLEDKLDVALMAEAAQEFCGEHDFLAFCSNKHFKKSSVRTITSFTVEQIGSEIVFTVSANGFLYNMVRIMVGTLVEIGLGRMTKCDIPIILESRVRENAGMTAPAKGLCLMEVQYR